ncbi:tetratricopeptide repeat protein [Crassaminicella profunda]|uniref:tetratricopeptide repeat protein n=1 Tax=Crassaminicella profunda TaxID=1286698 RepID=UPI001CA7098A|nr:hypothetical protein [Crassaminicella profunda]QZY54426.1 hypothetical protein K7H06_15470 [Crassaminicella profunda]
MNLVQKIKIKRILRNINRGNVERALNLTESMSEGYEKAFYKGVCYFEKGFLKEAEENLEHGLSKKENYHCTRVLVEVYLQKKEWDKAYDLLKSYNHIQDVKKMMKIIKDPKEREKYIMYYNLISNALKSIRYKAYDESIIYYEKALEYSIDKAYLYNQIGAIYLNYKKNKKIAQEYFLKAWEICPENSIYKKNYAKAKLM